VTQRTLSKSVMDLLEAKGGSVVKKRTINIALPVLVIALGAYLAGGWRDAAAQDLRQPSSASVLVQDSMEPQGVLSPIPSAVDRDLMSEADFYGPVLPADCGMGCWPAWYVRGEGLLMMNETYSRLSLSTGFELPRFSYEEGMRITAGRRWDCAEGWEVSYMGLLDWQTEGESSDYPLFAKFDWPDNEENISAFNNASYHRQIYRSSMFSIEGHRRFYDWDTMSCLLGVRYIDFHDSFQLFASSTAPHPVEDGEFRLGIYNRLIGPQAGVEMLHSIGATNFLTVSGSLKGGVYANIVDGRFRLINAGVVELNTRPDKVQIAATVDMALRANMQLTRRLSIHGGYEVWYMAGVGLAPSQTVSPITSDTGRRIRTDRETWFQGATLGAQYTW
jgi:hypothetical protein